MTVGAYWARNVASGGILWHELSQPVTGPFRHHARSAGDSQGYGMAPPAGFEPALTAPEAVALSPELWGLSAVERVPVNEPFPDTRRQGAAGLNHDDVTSSWSGPTRCHIVVVPPDAFW